MNGLLIAHMADKIVAEVTEQLRKNNIVEKTIETNLTEDELELLKTYVKQFTKSFSYRLKLTYNNTGAI